LFRDLSFNVGYRLEDVSLDRTSISRSSASLSSYYRSGLTSGVNGSITWDKRDDAYLPTRGFYQSVFGEVADGVLASDNEFFLLRGTSRWYTRPFAFGCPTDSEGGGFSGSLCRWFAQAVVKLNGEIAYVGSTDASKRVRVSERFFGGGPNDVRGFPRLSLGATAPCPTSNAEPAATIANCPIGGVRSLVVNAEMEFPVLSAVGLRGVVFADAGNSVGEDRPYPLVFDFAADPDDPNVLRTAWGFGIRWQSPIGPLRFEWGHPIDPRSGESDSVFEFSIGNSF
jgi:outer membrane protein insertion porin family